MTELDLDRLEHDGFVVLPGFIGPDTLEPVLAEISAMYPTADEFHGDPDSARSRRFRDSQFGGVDNLPFVSQAWNRLAVDERLLALARQALATDDIRLYQAESWAKYSSAIDYDQHHHRDFPNHTIVVPTADARFRHVEMFVYVNGVEPDLGPTMIVPRSQSRDIPPLPNWQPRAERPELYDAEVSVLGPPGTVLVYWPDTHHRGSRIIREAAARFTLHLNFRRSEAEWVGRRGWGNHANHDDWVTFVEGLAPGQLSVFGFPPPGHPYWTEETLAGVQARYPRLDMSPWFAGRDDCLG